MASKKIFVIVEKILNKRNKGNPQFYHIGVSKIRVIFINKKPLFK
jgi:hypothetical protein